MKVYFDNSQLSYEKPYQGEFGHTEQSCMTYVCEVDLLHQFRYAMAPNVFNLRIKCCCFALFS